MMTRQEYFEQLLDCLPEITPEDQQQIYEYYNELICDGMEEGKTEEEMLQHFGAPDELAVKMQEEWELSDLPSLTEGLVKTDKIPADPSLFSCDGIDCCYTSENLPNILELFIHNYALSVLPSSDEHLRIRFPKELQRAVQISENNGKLQFICKLKKQNPFLFFWTNQKNGNICLEIPPQKVRTLRTSFRNTPISIRDLALNEVLLKTTNAPIDAKALTADHLELITRNAAIRLEDVTYADASLKTSNASINVSATIGGILIGETSNARCHAVGVSASKLELVTSNAGISAEDCSAPSVCLHSSNGKIRVKDIRSNDISLSTSNGSIHGSIAGNESEYSITTGTSNGSCQPQTILRPEAPGKLSAHSSNGNIRIAFID